jgi:hypothetical protein
VVGKKIEHPGPVRAHFCETLREIAVIVVFDIGFQAQLVPVCGRLKTAGIKSYPENRQI